MREVTASGQTIDEAIQSALEQLDTTKDNVDIEVIDEGKKGFLGIFGSSRAVIKATLARDTITETEHYLKEMTANMGVDVTVETTVKKNNVTYYLRGEKIAILIGKRGKTLNAIQYLVQLALNRNSDRFYSVVVDAEGYREKRRKTLQSLARKMVDRAKKIDRKVALEPMPAFERKIIHSALQQLNGVTTYSEGVEPHRHIVIKVNK